MMKGIKCISKIGKFYYNYYKRKKEKFKGRLVVSKTGRQYRTYYQRKLRKLPIGEAPYSRYYKKECLERDNHTCQICGAIDNLDVHHKDNGGSHIKGKETNNKLSNLMTLCHCCHLKLHYKVLEKHKDIKIRRDNGYTLQEIADYYGVSRQRIHQIIKKYFFAP